MSTVTSRPVGYQSRPCVGCSSALHVPSSDTAPLCYQCRRGFALFEATKLASDVNALRKGLPPFHDLTLAERNEQLAALGLSPVAFEPKYPGFRSSAMENATLIEIVSNPRPFCTSPDDDEELMMVEAVAELERRLSLPPPTPQEREEIEARDDIETFIADDAPALHVAVH